jgi:hypothetical protein
MKKILLLVFGAMLVGSLAFGQTQVLSRNAVGYVKVSVLSNNLAFVGMNFKAFSNTVQGIFGEQLMGGTAFNNSDQVLRYDPLGGTYKRYWKRNSDGLWLNADTGSNTDTFDVAYGFWIRNLRTSNQTVYLMGEVPDSVNLAGTTVTVRIEQGLNQPAFGFPTAVAISNLSFGAQAFGGTAFNNSDQILKYDPVAKSYRRYWRSSALSQWIDADSGFATPDSIDPADGFWYRRRAGQPAFDWKENKPYSWPN